MSNEIFEIRFRKMYDRNLYKATVEITLKTENVIRVTIRAGNKEMKMEKLLFRKSNQWKVTYFNFTLGNQDKSNAKLILDIQEIIDFKLKEIY